MGGVITSSCATGQQMTMGAALLKVRERGCHKCKEVVPRLLHYSWRMQHHTFRTASA